MMSTRGKKNKSTKSRGLGSELTVRCVGFCGIDDSVSIDDVIQFAKEHGDIAELAVLFRREMEGRPRFATTEYVEKLCKATNNGELIPLAAHLCSKYIEDILTSGTTDFIRKLYIRGFRRIQINATKANGVDLSRLNEKIVVDNMYAAISSYPAVEWILQFNDETRGFIDSLITRRLQGDKNHNVSVLFDTSAGRGIPISKFPDPYPSIPCGYAGGISPANIEEVLTRIADEVESLAQADNVPIIWVDMESSLRTKVTLSNGTERDVFSLDHARKCCEIVKKMYSTKIISLL